MRSVIIITSFLFSTTLLAQRPFINNIDKSTAVTGDVIAISGSGFSTSASELEVYFGNGKGTIITASEGLITAQVPANATYGPVSVVNTSSQRVAYSSELFMLSFGGTTFDLSRMSSPVSYSTNQIFTYDLCACDFNQDGLNDIIVVNNGSPNINIYTNTTSGDTSSFAQTSINNSFNVTNITCRDIDLDGKPDFVGTLLNASSESNVFVYQNNSSGSISFTQATRFRIPAIDTINQSAKIARIQDMDMDGRPDLIIGSGNNKVIYIYRNTGSPGTISFASPSQISYSSDNPASNSGSIDVADLNNDNFPDIAVVPFSETEQIFFFKNNSSPGNIDMELNGSINSQIRRTRLQIGDLDQDGFNDLITTSIQSNRIDIIKNTSTASGDITFDTPSQLTSTGVWATDLGDINGDGQVDIIASSNTSNTMVVHVNDGGFSFTANTLTTSSNSRNIRVADVNGDGRSDILAAYNSAPSTNGELLVIENRHCMTPNLSPSTGQFCAGVPFLVTATGGAKVTYDWAITGGSTLNYSDTSKTIDISGLTGTVDIVVTAKSDGCSLASSSFQYSQTTDPPNPAVITGPLTPVCEGTSIDLTSSTTEDTYIWTGPNGFSSTGSTASVSITNATTDQAGLYFLRVQKSTGCISQPDTLAVQVLSPPKAGITNDGQDNFCENTTIDLRVPDFTTSGYSYQWLSGTTPITNQTNPVYAAGATGAYSVIISDGTCQDTTASYSISEVSQPVSQFTTPNNEICIDAPLAFTTNSVYDTTFSVSYQWNFDDGSGTITTAGDTTHTFGSVGSYNVSMITIYDNVSNCADTLSATIDALDINTVTIEVPGNNTEKCPSDSILLQLPSNYLSFDWSTGDNSNTTYAKTASDQDSVEVTVATITDIGCMAKGTIIITNYPGTQIGIEPLTTGVTPDTASGRFLIEAGIASVELMASGADSYTWTTDGTIIGDSTSATVEIRTNGRFTSVTVIGNTSQGCEETTTITLVNEEVVPDKFFSPDGNGINDCWEVLNISQSGTCEVYIFDNRGRNLYIGPPTDYDDDCVWDGVVNGSVLEEGVYFFSIKCDNGSIERAGNILLGK